jgi:4-hydroxyphenylacetate 3-monooxygenase
MAETPASTNSRQAGASTDAMLDGARYLASLRDSREVYIYGERVRDVTQHPAFRNACRSIARLYDALHDPKQRDILTGLDRFGTRTHKFFKPCYSAEELGDCRMVAAELRLHGPHAGLQGCADGQPRVRA